MSSRFFSLIARFALALEPLTPRFVSFFLRRRLKELKDKQLIDDYKIKTTRIGKLHYRVQMDVDLTRKQVMVMSRLLLNEIKARIRR